MPEQQTSTVTCAGCDIPSRGDTWATNGHVFESTNQFVCYDCLDRNVVDCAGCGIRMRNRDRLVNQQTANVWRATEAIGSMGYGVTLDTNETMCTDCSCFCDNCGERYEYEDNVFECCDNGGRRIHNYSFRPMYMFHDMMSNGTVVAVRGHPSRGKLYMGFEIELVYARQTLEAFYNISNESYDSPKFMYVKEDASIGENGAEFVTMPATLEAFEKCFPWQAFEAMHNEGARGWEYNSCGMHVHVSRSAFTPSHMYKFTKFQLENDSRCIAFAGRESHFAEWGNDTMRDMKQQPKKYCDERVGGERYSAINITPRTTIELRYFRSNINKDGILRNAQFIDALYEYTKTMDIVVPRNERWSWQKFLDFMADKKKYSLAFQYMERIECA